MFLTFDLMKNLQALHCNFKILLHYILIENSNIL